MFIGPGSEVEHHIQSIHLELVSDHLTMRGTGTCIPDGPIISDALHCRDGKSNDTFAGNTLEEFAIRVECSR